MIGVFAYNHETTVRQSLRSLAAALGDCHADVWIYDDASVDATESVIRSELKKGIFGETTTVHLKVRERNIGFHEGLKCFYEIARGKPHVVLSGDDFMAVRAIENLLAGALSDSSVGVAVPRVRLLEESGREIAAPRYYRRFWNSVQQPTVLKATVAHKTLVTLGNFVPASGTLIMGNRVSSPLASSLGLAHLEDYELWLRLSEVSDFVLVPNAEVFYTFSMKGRLNSDPIQTFGAARRLTDYYFQQTANQSYRLIEARGAISCIRTLIRQKRLSIGDAYHVLRHPPPISLALAFLNRIAKPIHKSDKSSM